MGADMTARTIYLAADTEFNLAAAEATASRLIDAATPTELDNLVERGWIDIDDQRGEDLDLHRGLATQALHQALRRMAASLDSRDVDSYRLDHDDNPGIDIYITGGLSAGDNATDAYGQWSVLLEDDNLPAGWAEQMAHAAGLVHPHGTGGIVACVTFRAWI